jgi:hypothetical protein
MAAPVNADTLFAVDPPDVQLAPGATADQTFNLNDFFDSTGGAVSYTATGGTVDANGVASVFGLSNPGSTKASFTGTNGAESKTVSSDVVVSSFRLGNRPAVDNNNRLAGVAGGNWFVNWLTPGSTFNSRLPLTGLPSGGSGGGSPGGVTGGGSTGGAGAALIATIANVGVNENPETGLRSRTINGSIATGAGSASNGSLTATLNADGSYSLVAGANYSGAQIVTLGARSGASVDAVHLLAAKATDITSLTTLEGTSVTLPGSVTVPAGAAVLAYGDAVPVNTDAQISLYANTPSGSVNIAAIGFDGALAFQGVSYTNPGGANIEANALKCIGTAIRATSNSVLPAFQVFNAGTAPVTVQIQRLVVVDSGPLIDYAVNLNAKAALPVDGTIPSGNGWQPDILAAGAKSPTASTANHYAGGGSLGLNGSGSFANGSVITSLGKGTAVAEAWIQRVGAADAGSNFTLNVTDGGANSFQANTPGNSIPDTGWWKTQASGTLSAAAPQVFLTVQAAGVNVNVDDVSIRVITDKDNHFDATLLGGL